MSYQIEICANSVQSAVNAELGGADRVELCDNLWEGGTTPSIGSIELAKKLIGIPVFVLVRPRGGDFTYSDLEFDLIRRDIQLARQVGADGIVSGVLLPDGTVDIRRTKELIKLTRPLPFTFHRAFDLTPDPMQALEDLISCGADRVLTSGQGRTVMEGMGLIKGLIEKSSNRIILLPGGGVNEGNVINLHKAGCREFHFSAKSATSGMARYANKIPMNGSLDIPENELVVSDPDKIHRIKKVLDELY